MRIRRVVLLVSLLAIAPVVAGCSNFDPDNLDVFGLNEKKKLPGQREDLFPGGVPGVTQGIPPEYMKGSQGAAEPDATLPTEPKTAAAPAPEKPKAKPKPKVRQAARPKTQSKPTRIDVGPAKPEPAQPAEAQPAPAAAPAAQQPAASGWPAPAQNAPSSSSSAWPAPQPSGTFQR